ncbi:SDR family NAD(P)-dependent oxidoreductase [Sagittula stellata]|uniref:SDR family NAD(P)-dependent oxidoreductase n=1 Tax=Sagittula stellata TaxID=52603 RepID=UPI001E2D192E|nr:SDR family NAD(P)-dependent oxidoreductase [Sagittula stellata]
MLARDVLKAGDRVVATSVTVDGIADNLSTTDDRLLVLPLDVTDPEAASAAHDAAIEAFGRIDVLVNDAVARSLVSLRRSVMWTCADSSRSTSSAR